MVGAGWSRRDEAAERIGMATGARGKGRPKRTETAEIDRAIRDAALTVLLEHGEAATMQAVAVAAGLSRKSLYARYPNKCELFLEVIRELLDAVTALEYESGGSAEDRLLHYVQAVLAVIARPDSQALQRLLRIDPIYISTLRAEMIDASQRLFFDPLVALLDEAGTRGELVVEDVATTARVLIRLIFADALGAAPEAGVLLTPAQQARHAAFLTRLITRGLSPRGR
jgi:AcrR family transcriptional regulator